MALNRGLEHSVFERRLFAAAAVLFPLIVLAGFARTYYLKGFFHAPPLASLLVHTHGLLMTIWIALFITQVWLISADRVKTHQRLGFAGVALAVPIIVVGFFTAVHAAKFGPSTSAAPPDIPRLSFLLIPLTDLLVFAVLLGAAVYNRKRPAAHKRLMLLTVLGLLPPAVARIPIESLRALGPFWFFGLPTLLALLSLALDYYNSRKMNKAFLGGTIFLILSFVLRLAVMGTSGWLRIAAWLTSWAA